MKKLTFSGVLLFLLMGCGNGFKLSTENQYSTKKEKEQFIEKMLVSNDEDMEKKLEKIILDLKLKIIYQEDSISVKQLVDWVEAYSFICSSMGNHITDRKNKNKICFVETENAE